MTLPGQIAGIATTCDAADTGVTTLTMALLLLNCLALLATFQGPPPGGVLEGAVEPTLPGAMMSEVLRAKLVEPMRTRNWGQAEEILAAEIERHPGSRDLLVLLGRIFFIDGKTLNAAVALLKSEKLGPLDADSRFVLALAFSGIERADLARPYLRKLHEERPANPNYLYWLGRLDFEAQHFDDAAAEYTEIVRTTPEFARAWDGLGLSFEALGKFEEAGKYYSQAVERNRRQSKRSPWPPYNYGSMLVGLGHYDEAEPFLKEAIANDPGFARAHLKYGVLHERRGDFEKALSELQRAAALDSNDAGPFPALIRIYHILGRNSDEDRALAEFQQRKSRAAAMKLRK
jgi:tetratricopeptide (TPR) repeat protein